MITGLKPYPAYRDSGVPWLGDIPAHWQQLPGRACFVEKKAPNVGLQETTVLSLSYGQVVVKPPEKLHGLVPASFETYQIIEPYDIVIRPTDLQNDWVSLRTGLAKTGGIITSAYMCLQTKNTLTPEYGHLLLHAYDLKKVFYGLGSGLRQNLSWRDFKYLPCLAPPPEEQAAIARFLDYVDRRIRRYIRAKKKLIALLEEQKQALIQRAVTRGLDPNVRLKPSGVEWLGDIPEHWEVSRVKHEFTCLDHKRVPLSSVERGFMTSKKYDYYGASGIIDQVDNYLFDDELLLIAEDGANLVLRNLPLAIIARGKFWVNNHAHVLKPKRGSLDFLANLMEAIDYRPWISGAAQPKLTGERLMSIWIPVPPVHEQHEIAEQLLCETAALDSAIERAKRQIDLIREYRTCLIADVVMGKLDVRQAAANLPEEVEEPEGWGAGQAEEESGKDLEETGGGQ